MANKKNHKFTMIGEYLGNARNISTIADLVSDMQRITAILHSALPMTRELCHCGAIDYSNDLLVFFANSNAAFYLVNNLIPAIQDCLADNGVHFTQLLVKVHPATTTHRPKIKHIVSPEQYEQLKKFAEAINRPDLLKPQAGEIEADTSEDWQIKF